MKFNNFIALLTLGLLIYFSVILAYALSTPTDREREFRYTIDMPNRKNYYTNDYTMNGGCITFKTSYNDTITVCGNYTIIKR